ncbi:WYL domain-containing protein [Riemerella anatipestifer]|uniref:helix-turn-helix transcriptional regulator n=1 Tax=Riemerella anatipestifer TaxID=34085 RepID=UPI0020973618|nr:WYL domain-containing protein [Riemerella anatipestifer]MCO7355375.1 WYL domain-containing protein [Riemerella anatipestifer]
MVIEQIFRLKYIEEFLKRRKDRGASYREIFEYLSERFINEDLDLSFTNRTFLRDKKLIEKLSGINISYDKNKKVYIISDDEPEEYFESLLLLNAYRSSKKNADILLFENRSPRGITENLEDLLNAINKHKIISFKHYSLWNNDEIPKLKKIKPYALKEFRYRWYVLGQAYDDGKTSKEITAYGLDRISDLEVSSSSFVPEIIDIENLYKDSFGIVLPNGMPPEKIILSFDKQQGSYIKKLPIHHSQKVEKETDTETIISVFLVPTYDFWQEILSYGRRVKVLQPKSFVDTIKNELEESLANYTQL